MNSARRWYTHRIFAFPRSYFRQARILAYVLRLQVTGVARVMDQMYLRGAFNWESPDEQEKYHRVLADVSKRLGAGSWGNVLEIGSGEGLFTEQLAGRCESVTAYDISSIACERARWRCLSYGNVDVRQVNVEQGSLSGRYDAVFAMDVVECIQGRAKLDRVVKKLSDALRPKGLLIVSGCRLPAEMRHIWWARQLALGADQHLALCIGRPELRLISRQQHPSSGEDAPGYISHLIALFEKEEA